MRMEDAAQVRETPLFSGMSEQVFDALTTGAFLQTFPPHVELFREGEAADFLYVVMDGMVELYAAWNNREAAITTVRPTGTFILAAVVRDACYLMSARTLGRCRLLMLPAASVRQALTSDHAFAIAMIDELSGCYRAAVKAQKNLKLRTGVERLAAYLLQTGTRSGASGFELPCDKRTLASLLGMTAENLSRAFATLRPYGVIVSGSTITLAAPDDLARLAKPAALIDDLDPAALGDG
ncbi:MAG: cyclic nucleotide-binding domain-containing protein [Devosia sp.]|uniref:cyclic nucleotide-binding domain-containing protein n=1 Tax=Devosia sp. TaxID=1871048 RepID=UPI001AC4C252|nr:cyclic nucleotide-binding domain-containing protein [Devosia sp.]MBN9307694.1 cyclic nucleotide-binding domain-containing protein [Devosia sp.]MBN9315257.1 cyclic nucleotide-binding domain-containing protein [Devosia sp.]